MCMGRTHSILGATLGLALATPLAGQVLHRPLGVAELAAFTLATAGYSLLPDFDHPQATLARTLGPVTRAIATGVGAVSGGHRKGTHTVWFAAITVGVASVLCTSFGRDGALPLLFLGYFTALMVLRIAPRGGSGLGELVYAAEAAGLTAATDHWVGSWWWLPWAVGMGVIWHIAGDILTTEGVPILYPLAKRFVVKVPVLGHTNSPREHTFALLLLLAFAWMALAVVTGHHWWTVSWATQPQLWQLAAWWPPTPMTS